jgi:AcrR family transcriptional regulator
LLLPSATVATPTTRRTQEQRRAEMRDRLLDATIESLLEDGYAATTLRAVAARAGVSSGAMTHHFPRRVDLVGAAVERLTEQRVAALRAAADQLPVEQAERVPALLNIVWVDFSSDLFAIAVKLWIAADDDPDLYERLVPTERLLAREIATAVAELSVDFSRDDLAARVTAVLATMRGLALTDAFLPRRRGSSEQWALVRPVLERLILAP